MESSPLRNHPQCSRLQIAGNDAKGFNADYGLIFAVFGMKMRGIVVADA